MTDWAALFHALTADTFDTVDTVTTPTAGPPQSVKSVHFVSLSEKKNREAEALARDTIERLRTGMAGYPTDTIERAEREDIEAESQGELATRDTPDMAPPRAHEPDAEVAEHLAVLGPTVSAAFTSRPDGRVEVRHPLADGRWSAPTILPAPGAAGTAA